MPYRRELDARPPAVADSAGSAAAELDALRSKAFACRNCDLWRNATQTVFGEGPVSARLMGRGAARRPRGSSGSPVRRPGRRCSRPSSGRGRRRQIQRLPHQRRHAFSLAFERRRSASNPRQAQLDADRRLLHWLEREIELVEPSLLVALGATAGQAILGRTYRVTRDRGQVLESAAGIPVIRHHPSLGRPQAADDATRRQQFGGLVDDLRAAVRAGGARRAP
jgi:uracil-DNA glycosylase family 4